MDSYPVVEKYGIVFAFLGDLPENERPPLLDIEEFADPAWRANSVLVLEVDYYYERSLPGGLTEDWGVSLEFADGVLVDFHAFWNRID